MFMCRKFSGEMGFGVHGHEAAAGALMAKAGGIDKLQVSASFWVCRPMETAFARIIVPMKPLNSVDSTKAANLD